MSHRQPTPEAPDIPLYPISTPTISQGADKEWMIADPTTSEAFLKMKMYMACNIRYNKKNKITKPTDWRAKEIISAYNNTFRKLGIVFAEEVVSRTLSNSIAMLLPGTNHPNMCRMVCGDRNGSFKGHQNTDKRISIRQP